MDGKGPLRTTDAGAKGNLISSSHLPTETMGEAFRRQVIALLKQTSFCALPEKVHSTPLKKKDLIAYKVSQLNKQKRPYILKPTTSLKCKPKVDDNASLHILKYMSKGESVNLNCIVNRNDNGKIIECRHLSHAYALGRIGSAGKKFSCVDTAEKLRNNSDIPTETELVNHQLNKMSKLSYYFYQRELGLALQELIIKQKTSGSEIKSYFIESLRHLMGLKIQVLGKQEEVLMEVYNPNVTNRVQRLIFPSLESVVSLSCEDIFGSSGVNFYVPDKDYCLSITSLEVTKDLKNCDVNIIGDLNYYMLYILLTHGHFGHELVCPKVRKLIQDNSHDKQALQKILAADISPIHPPAIAFPLHNGYKDSVKYFMQEVFASSLDDAIKESILSAKDNNGVPAFNTALMIEYSQSVDVFMEEVLKSNLRDEIKEKLISACFNSSGPVLHETMVNGIDSDNIRVYIEKVLDCNLGAEAKKRLLTAKCDEGFSCLIAALLHMGHSQNIKLFVDGVANSQLAEKDKLELLNVMCDEESVLSYALEKGDRESVDVYEQAIQESILQESSKVELLKRDV